MSGFLPQGSSVLSNGIVHTYSTITSDTTLDSTYYVVLADASSAKVTVTLPASSSNGSRIYHIKKIDSSGNTVVVTGNASETIDGVNERSLSIQYESISILNDGSGWHII